MDKIFNRRTEKLPCKLSPGEIREKLEEQSRAVDALRKAEEERKLEAKRLKAVEDRYRERVCELNDVCESGEERRQVSVYDMVIIEERKVATVREDTGQIIYSRPALESELQDAAQGELSFQ